jgi:hypothetical protein
MTFRFYCECGQLFKVEEAWVGRRAKCNSCGDVVTIPSPPSTAESFDLDSFSLNIPSAITFEEKPATKPEPEKSPAEHADAETTSEEPADDSPELTLPDVAPRLTLPEAAPRLKIPEAAPRLKLPEETPRLELPEETPQLTLPDAATRLKLPEEAPPVQLPDVPSEMTFSSDSLQPAPTAETGPIAINLEKRKPLNIDLTKKSSSKATDLVIELGTEDVAPSDVAPSDVAPSDVETDRLDVIELDPDEIEVVDPAYPAPTGGMPGNAAPVLNLPPHVDNGFDGPDLTRPTMATVPNSWAPGNAGMPRPHDQQWVDRNSSAHASNPGLIRVNPLRYVRAFPYWAAIWHAALLPPLILAWRFHSSWAVLEILPLVVCSFFWRGPFV